MRAPTSREIRARHTRHTAAAFYRSRARHQPCQSIPARPVTVLPARTKVLLACFFSLLVLVNFIRVCLLRCVWECLCLLICLYVCMCVCMFDGLASSMLGEWQWCAPLSDRWFSVLTFRRNSVAWPIIRITWLHTFFSVEFTAEVSASLHYRPWESRSRGKFLCCKHFCCMIRDQKFWIQVWRNEIWSFELG